MSMTLEELKRRADLVREIEAAREAAHEREMEAAYKVRKWEKQQEDIQKHKDSDLADMLAEWRQDAGRRSPENRVYNQHHLDWERNDREKQAQRKLDRLQMLEEMLDVYIKNGRKLPKRWF